MKSFLKKHEKKIGMALILVGAILLVVTEAVAWVPNALLVTALIFVVAGVVFYVKSLKDAGKY
jgi:membrane-bound ClpP family serine protease